MKLVLDLTIPFVGSLTVVQSGIRLDQPLVIRQGASGETIVEYGTYRADFAWRKYGKAARPPRDPQL